MRVAVLGTAVWLSALGLCVAQDAKASIRKHTNIPSETLANALQTLGRERGLQVVYRSEVVGDIRSQGASGELTDDEAIGQLLNGTRLTYHHLDEKTITIVSSTAASQDVEGPSEQGPTEQGRATQRTGNSDTAEKAEKAEKTEKVEEVVVRGYRMSLETAAEAKKNATNFTDSIFAEDFGKFPDLNLAESLQRLPGVQIDRDVSGEGTYINVRGLGPGFTVTTINGFSISTPNGANEGRGSSLDMLPSELFRWATLSKSPTADMVEGGTAGVVNLQPARAFDQRGFHVNYQLQDTYQTVGGNNAPREALFVSDTFDTGIGGIGVLLGLARAEKTYRSDIFNTVGYTTLNLGKACPSGTPGCNSLSLTGNKTNPSAGYGGGAGATLTTIPGNIPPELGLGSARAPLVQCGNGVPGGTSGLSCQDLSYAIVPRLVRAEQIGGNRNRNALMFNLEWRPSESLNFKLDSMYADTRNHYGQYDVMAVIRSYNNTVPVNFQLDPNHVLTSGTFANTYFLNQSSDYRTYGKMFYQSLQADWKIADDWRLSLEGMHNNGYYLNQSVVYTLQSAPPQSASNLTPLNTGQYATYTDTPGDLTPFLTTNVDLPNYNGWYWNGITIIPTQRDFREYAYRADLHWGDASKLQISAGVLRSHFYRHIATWNVGDCAYQGNCGFAYAVTPQYPVAKVVAPDGSQAATSVLQNYLVPLPYNKLFSGSPFNVGFNSGWLVPDFNRLNRDLHIGYFTYGLNPGTDASNYLNTYSPKVIQEDKTAPYLMADGRFDLFGRNLVYNAGVRFVNEDSSVAGLVNDYILIGGAGNRVVDNFPASYRAILPSVNFAYYLNRNLLFRGAGARTVTAPDPGDLAPSYGLSLDGDQFTLGNPKLEPFYANNYDLGLEWYPRSKAVMAFNVWAKDIFNYPATIQFLQPFGDTGLDWNKLSTRQQTGITNLGNGDYQAAQITIIQKQNSSLVIHLLGEEFQWVQPLDFVTTGLGFSANVTHIGQTLSGAVPPGTNTRSLLTGLAPWTYNATLFYERPSGFSARVSYTHRDANLFAVCPCYNVPGDLYSVATNYMDAQLTFPMPGYNRLKFTVQAQNLIKQVQLNRYNNYESEPDGATYAGRTYVIGVRGEF